MGSCILCFLRMSGSAIVWKCYFHKITYSEIQRKPDMQLSIMGTSLQYIVLAHQQCRTDRGRDKTQFEENNWFLTENFLLAVYSSHLLISCANHSFWCCCDPAFSFYKFVSTTTTRRESSSPLLHDMLKSGRTLKYTREAQETERQGLAERGEKTNGNEELGLTSSHVLRDTWLPVEQYQMDRVIAFTFTFHFDLHPKPLCWIHI